MNTIQFLENKGYSTQDKICVFCSITTDRWNSFCSRCKEYKGLINIVQAVEYYGRDILPD